MASFNICEEDFKKLDGLACCPVCMKRMNRINCCVYGHAVCISCKQKLIKCPTCRGPFRQHWSDTLLKELLKAIPTKCEEEECKTLQASHEYNHSRYCDFRRESCFTCVQLLKVNNLADHYKVEHPKFFVQGDKMQYRLPIGEEFEHTSLFMVTGDQFFQVRISPDLPKGNILHIYIKWMSLSDMSGQDVTYKASVTTPEDSELAPVSTVVLNSGQNNTGDIYFPRSSAVKISFSVNKGSNNPTTKS